MSGEGREAHCLVPPPNPRHWSGIPAALPPSMQDSPTSIQLPSVPDFLVSLHKSEHISSKFLFPTCKDLGYTRVILCPLWPP